MGREDALALSHLAEKARLLPERPGVYLFRDAAGEVLYVGKAASLRQRVRSYFQSPAGLAPKVLRMLEAAAELDHIVTDSEVEALILECNLIKRHRPRFNVRLRDDKNYPYLRVSLQEEWPRVQVARRRRDDGARYFGPYAHAQAVYETLRALRPVFPYRSCSDRRLRQGPPPCLYYHIHRCPAPCAGLVSPEEYRRTIGQLVAFLDGRHGDLLKELRSAMEEAAERLAFEEAARLRDRLRALELVVEKQKMVSDRLADQDFIAVARDGGEVCAQVFFVREGQVVGREPFLLQAPEGVPDAEVLGAFLEQYYAASGTVPPEVVVAEAPEDVDTIRAWLAAERGGPVRLTVPRRGEKRRLLDMVRENARLYLQERALEREHRRQAVEGAAPALQEALGLAAPPRRVECFDVSNTQGHEVVASVVVFQDGRPDRSSYRRFRIREVRGAPDDFAAMREAVFRRFRRGLA
ncbi:MAG: excinuclease ABC subunit UvrC, partial [Clostridia bacterium]|nr:excinuclease ABC subunit UvrC [Clostridia bacterium]